ncbi:DUF2294 family protein [Clostridium sp. D2Q-14]|uniref:Na-translocating system protein MpsC family protein n=1 Tax=Anaeromonas gelatinilytica TaxID=2683194 RepID=UPI00193C54D1|nr:Na-translocating system protein MpsC family protein [Anaeromonas gelatinilytica]MBS4534729.1 DUF2294 family protein [Anaeromonas gelatinilytica]
MSLDNGLLKNLKVLYVEDEEEILEQMTFFLKKRVGQLIVAEDGIKGLKAFKEYRPDIVICDLKMPYMDGLSMAREIRKISYVPIIITTAFSDKEVILKAVDIGIENYIVKPIDVRELTDIMRKTAIKFLRNKGELIALRNRAITKKDKLEIEEKIKNAFGKFVKNKTGKGPQNTKVFIRSNILEIESIGTLTKMERSLLKLDKNKSIIVYNRETLYRDYEADMKEIIKQYLTCDVNLDSIDIDIINDKTLLKFIIAQKFST